MPGSLIKYLRDSAARLRKLAMNKPDIAEKLDALADSLDAKASEIEADQGPAPPAC
jgi:hypothetical protein